MALVLVLLTGQLLDLPRAIVYPAQTLLVAGLLLCYRKSYRDEIKVVFDWTAVAAGVAVFLVWVSLEGRYPHLGQADGSSYAAAGNGWVVIFRLAGAALVVPVAEELFWRSFALRFLIRSEYRSVSLGAFTWLSFACVTLAFGFEHHRWLPGIIAGAVYAVLLYRTKNLFSPILSHAVTNALLGIYVIATGNWHFW
jgi:CAAX prenyl protease-like protein